MKKKAWDHALGISFPGANKILLKMKLTLCIILISFFGALASESYSQTTKLSLDMKNTTVKDVLGAIETQSEFFFLYSEKIIDVTREVNIEVRGSTIEKILDRIFAGTNVNYTVKGRQIVLTTPEANLFETSSSTHQQKSVSGKVTDSAGSTLPGVSVVIKGTTTGTIADSNGNYSLLNVPENAILQFSFVGMKTQEIAVGGKTTINIQLADEAIGIEEVVAVGYGTQKKVNMTGAISSVNFEEIGTMRPLLNTSSALAGLSSGVSVKQGNGKPGSDGATILVRGVGTLNNSNPLIIIDGMEGVLDAVNPQDIESISILKDAASASIYGSRAANGVVLVTTKKGGKKRLSVTYNGIFSLAQPTNLLQSVSDYPTYMKLINESARNIGSAEIFAASTIQAWETANKNPNALNAIGVPNYVAFPNVDWNHEIYRNKLIHDHTISVNGSSQNARFLLSAGYIDNPGLVDYTGLQRFSLRSNVEIDVAKWLTIGTRIYGNMTDTEMGDYSTVLANISQSNPGNYGMYNGMSGYPEAPEERAIANNIYSKLYALKGDDKVSRINSTLYSKVTFTKGLSWDLNFNYVKRFDEYNSHTNPWAGKSVKFSTGQVVTPETPNELLTTYYKTYGTTNYTLENLLRYETTIADKHEIKGLLGYNESSFSGYSHYATKQGLFDESASVFNAATQMISVGGTATDWTLRSYFGRINYAFNQRYLLEANMRYDGSSHFSADSRHGLFPSFSAGWRISEEGFMKDKSIFQNLKLRASWGKLGNNATGSYDSSGKWVDGNYDYQALYGPVSYSFNGIQATGLRSGKISNMLLQWESTSVANLGLDAILLNGRLSAEVDAYNKVTDGILTTPPVYLTMGLISSPTLNTAEVTNRGIDLTLGWHDQIGQVKYSITGNISYNKNEVTGYKGKLKEEWTTSASGTKSYSSNLGSVSSGSNTRIVEDHIINEYYLMDVYNGSGSYFNSDGTVNVKGGPRDGMIRTQEDMSWLNSMIAAGYKFMPNLNVAKNKIWYGDYIYSDINGDGIYGNSYDKRFTGNSNMPKFIFGSQMNFSWKNFDLNLIWSGQAGVKLLWLERGYNSPHTRLGFQIGKMLENDHYFYNEADPNNGGNNINANYPRLVLDENNTQNTQASTRWLYDGSYLRLKNLTIGYTLPSNIAKRIFAEQVRLYSSAENLFTITSFPGLDPEMGGNTNYPVIRQIAFGTNITF